MADASMTLAERSAEFFAAIDSEPEAGRHLARYPIELVLTTPEEQVAVEFKDGVPGPVRDAAGEESGYWTLEMRGDRKVFEAIFEGSLTMGEAMFAAMLVLPEEKAKHNFAVAVGQTIRLVQEEHRRATDPRREAAAERK